MSGNLTRTAGSQNSIGQGPWRAKVIKHLDPSYMGKLTVSLKKNASGSDNPGTEETTVTASYLSPFYGATGKQHLTENKDYNASQQSYGFWMIPPDAGTDVLVIALEGNAKEYFWIGCVQDDFINMQVPGVAPATDTRWKDDEPGEITGSRLPTSEINTLLEDNKPNADATKTKRAYHPHQAAFLQEQGLLDDWVRGTTTSSARREAPSMVFGFSSPGPLDKTGPKGPYGSKTDNVMRHRVRLGGTSLVMDDGDASLVRQKPASEGPPEYKAEGTTNIPANELFRVRTRTGHQILLHNSEDLIYIGNARGTSWIEMTSNGKIDIYAQDSVSIHTENDFNFKAGRDVNIEAGNNVNISAGQSIVSQAGADWSVRAEGSGLLTAQASVNLYSGADTMITAGGTSNINSAGHYETANPIHMNGPEAATAAQASSASKPVRVPLHEPWFGHEHLDPEAATPEQTAAAVGEGEETEEIEGTTRESELADLDETRFPEEPPEFPSIPDTFTRT
jgi:hypothetical protein